MAIEKITLGEISAFKRNLEIEKKLPAAEQLINDLAKPFMEEVQQLTLAKRDYSIDGDYLIVEHKEETTSKQPSSIEQVLKNIEILKKNAEKLDKIPTAEKYVQMAIKKGKTEEDAVKEYMDKLLKFAHGRKEIENLSDAELEKMANEVRED